MFVSGLISCDHLVKGGFTAETERAKSVSLQYTSVSDKLSGEACGGGLRGTVLAAVDSLLSTRTEILIISGECNRYSNACQRLLPGCAIMAAYG